MAERLIGMLIFPRLTQLDMTGPYEVLARLPNTKVHLVAHTHGAGEDRPRHADRADHDLRRLSAARSGHGAGRARPAGFDGRRGRAGSSSRQAGGGREIRHLGLHRLAGAGRGGLAQGQARHQPLGGDRASEAARRHSGERSGWRWTANLITGGILRHRARGLRGRRPGGGSARRWHGSQLQTRIRSVMVPLPRFACRSRRRRGCGLQAALVR